MVSKTLALLTLSVSLAVARPQHHSHFHHSGSGMHGTGWAYPTGGSSQFNDSNGSAYSTGGASADLSISATPTEAVAAAADTTSCTTYSTSTEYATSVSYVTVTADNAADISLSSSSSAAVAAGAFYGGHSHDGNSYTTRTSSTFAVVTTPATSSSIAYTTAPAATVSSAAPAASSSSSGSSSGSSSAKKGLSYESTSLLSLFSGADASWAYNWGSSSGGSLPSGVEYVPMCWGSAAAAGCASAVTTSGASYMLSFNEPDLGAQSNLDPATAAKLHIQYVAGPLAGKVKIGSPAITSSENAGQGLSWMKTFLDDCGSSCKIDFMAIHWYGDTTQLSMFQSHVGQAIALASSYGINKVWITEFAATGAVADQATFLEKACSWLDTQSAVDRYAYFMAGPASGGLGMVTGTTLNAVGLAYDS